MGLSTLLLPILAIPALCSHAPAPRRLAPAAPAPQVRPLSGRIGLIHRGQVEHLKPGPPRSVPGPAYLELGPNARAEILWPGEAGLRVTGPASIEWGAEGGVRFADFHQLDIDVRRGAPRTLLLSGWRIKLGVGAANIARRPDGSLQLTNHGPAVASVSRNTKKGTRRPRPVRVGAGASLRFGGGSAAFPRVVPVL